MYVMRYVIILIMMCACLCVSAFAYSSVASGSNAACRTGFSSPPILCLRKRPARHQPRCRGLTSGPAEDRRARTATCGRWGHHRRQSLGQSETRRGHPPIAGPAVSPNVGDAASTRLPSTPVLSGVRFPRPPLPHWASKAVGAVLVQAWTRWSTPPSTWHRPRRMTVDGRAARLLKAPCHALVHHRFRDRVAMSGRPGNSCRHRPPARAHRHTSAGSSSGLFAGCL